MRQQQPCSPPLPGLAARAPRRRALIARVRFLPALVPRLALVARALPSPPSPSSSPPTSSLVPLAPARSLVSLVSLASLPAAPPPGVAPLPAESGAGVPPTYYYKLLLTVRSAVSPWGVAARGPPVWVCCGLRRTGGPSSGCRFGFGAFISSSPYTTPLCRVWGPGMVVL